MLFFLWWEPPLWKYCSTLSIIKTSPGRRELPTISFLLPPRRAKKDWYATNETSIIENGKNTVILLFLYYMKFDFVYLLTTLWLSAKDKDKEVIGFYSYGNLKSILISLNPREIGLNYIKHLEKEREKHDDCYWSEWNYGGRLACASSASSS